MINRRILARLKLYRITSTRTSIAHSKLITFLRPINSSGSNFLTMTMAKMMIILGRPSVRSGLLPERRVKPSSSMLLRKTHTRKEVSLSSGLKHCKNRTVLIYSNLVNLQMKWKATGLMNTDSFFDFWDKSDPYLKFIKIRSDNTFI